jgi:hypothetical protein
LAKSIKDGAFDRQPLFLNPAQKQICRVCEGHKAFSPHYLRPSRARFLGGAAQGAPSWRKLFLIIFKKSLTPSVEIEFNSGKHLNLQTKLLIFI